MLKKICDMCTLQKYVAIVYSHKTNMPIQEGVTGGGMVAATVAVVTVAAVVVTLAVFKPDCSLSCTSLRGQTERTLHKQTQPAKSS